MSRWRLGHRRPHELHVVSCKVQVQVDQSFVFTSSENAHRKELCPIDRSVCWCQCPHQRCGSRIGGLSEDSFKYIADLQIPKKFY